MRQHSLIPLCLLYACMLLVARAAVADSSSDGSSDNGPWMVRLRGVYLDTANKSDPIPSLGVPRDAIHVNSKALPDLDFEYFFVQHISAELVLTYPQAQTVTVEKSALGGPTRIGTFRHLPPVITAKYDFLPNSIIRPYLGLGVNITMLWDDNLAVPTTPSIPLTLSNHSIGVAAQGGFDVQILPRLFLNADVKWVHLGADVKADGQTVSTVHVDPWLLGLGVGYRF